MGFAADWKKVCDRAGDRVETVVKAGVLGLGAAIVQKSPVDTGRFKGNWQYGSGTINPAVTEVLDKSGTVAIGKISAGLQSWSVGELIYITNSLPYAKRLEFNAWSKQAPGGMVRLSIQAFKDNISAVARSIS